MANTMQIEPEQNGYQFTPGAAVTSIQLDGGRPRVRKEVSGNWSTVNVEWRVGPEGWRYLNAFFNDPDFGGQGATLFNILLWVAHDTQDTVQAYFVPGTFGIKSTQGLTIIVGATLSVSAVPYTADDKAWLVNYKATHPNPS